MKNLKDIISEKLIINKHSKVKNNKLKDPIIGKTAWDYNGEPWEIHKSIIDLGTKFLPTLIFTITKSFDIS